MRTRHLYLLGCVVGTLLPLSQFVRHLAEDPGTGLQRFLMGTLDIPLASFWASDVVISAVVLLTFVLVEGRRLGMPRLWLYFVTTCCIGVSLGLPLFLLHRHDLLARRREAEALSSPAPARRA